VRAVDRGRADLRGARPACRIAITIVLLLAIAPGCRRQETTAPVVRVAMRVIPDPPVVGTAAIELGLTDPAGSPVRGAQVAIEGTMTHAGMAPSFATAAEVSPGIYRSRLELTMAGDWVVLVDTRLASGAVVRSTLALPAVRAR
jgi:hypothetical protein